MRKLLEVIVIAFPLAFPRLMMSFMVLARLLEETGAIAEERSEVRWPMPVLLGWRPLEMDVGGRLVPIAMTGRWPPCPLRRRVQGAVRIADERGTRGRPTGGIARRVKIQRS